MVALVKNGQTWFTYKEEDYRRNGDHAYISNRFIKNVKNVITYLIYIAKLCSMTWVVDAKANREMYQAFCIKTLIESHNFFWRALFSSKNYIRKATDYKRFMILTKVFHEAWKSHLKEKLIIKLVCYDGFIHDGDFRTPHPFALDFYNRNIMLRVAAFYSSDNSYGIQVSEYSNDNW